MARKLALAGKYSPVPFIASPIYITSQIAAPQLASLQVYVPPERWSEEAVMDVAREIASTLGPTEQYDIGIWLEKNSPYEPGAAATSGPGARVTKLDPGVNVIVLRMGDTAWRATYPRLDFERIGVNEWEMYIATGAAGFGVEAL